MPRKRHTILAYICTPLPQRSLPLVGAINASLKASLKIPKQITKFARVLSWEKMCVSSVREIYIYARVCVCVWRKECVRMCMYVRTYVCTCGIVRGEAGDIEPGRGGETPPGRKEGRKEGNIVDNPDTGPMNQQIPHKTSAHGTFADLSPPTYLLRFRTHVHTYILYIPTALDTRVSRIAKRAREFFSPFCARDTHKKRISSQRFLLALSSSLRRCSAKCRESFFFLSFDDENYSV